MTIRSRNARLVPAYAALQVRQPAEGYMLESDSQFVAIEQRSGQGSLNVPHGFFLPYDQRSSRGKAQKLTSNSSLVLKP